MTLSYKETGKSRFGFQLTVLDGSNNMAGDLTSTSSRTSTQFGSGSLSSREYIDQTSSGNSGNDSIKWTFEWEAPSSNLDTLIFYVVLNSTNSNGQSSGDHIMAKTFKVGPSSLLPTASISASNSTVCAGDSVQFYGSSSDSSASYSWTFPAGSPGSSTLQNPKVKFNFASNPKVKLVTSNSYGSSEEVEYSLSVKAKPNASIIGGNKTICEGDSVQLLASFDPQASYLWSNGMTSNQIYVKDSGDYYVTVTKQGCVAVSSSIHVGFYPKPMTGLAPQNSSMSDTACNEADFVLEGQDGYINYYYLGNGVLLSQTDTQHFEVNPTTTTLYGLVVEDGNGCFSDTADYLFTVIDAVDHSNGFLLSSKRDIH